jgi:carboxypeptidase Taq
MLLSLLRPAVETLSFFWNNFLDVSIVIPIVTFLFLYFLQTTRFKDDITEGLTGAIHETGHALYEQGRNLEYDGLPVSAAAGMAIHESQSLLWERQVALSLPFSRYLLPKLKEAFPDVISADKTPEDLYAALNQIKVPSKIRVEADEVTYPMHIILRYVLLRNYGMHS